MLLAAQCDDASTQDGGRVSIVEALPEPSAGIHHAKRAMLLDMLKDRKVTCLTRAELREITDDGIIILDENSREKKIPCETVVLALGLEPRRELYEALRKNVYDLHLVGDCREPRRIMHAIWDAFYVASS